MIVPQVADGLTSLVEVRGYFMRTLIVSAAACLSVVGLAKAAEAMNGKLLTRTAFDIPAQPLGTSLKQFADQAGVQILFEEKVVAGILTKPVKAELSVNDALNELLGNTELEFTAKDETIAIRKKGPARTPAGPSSMKGEKIGGLSNESMLRVAQRDPAEGSSLDNTAPASRGFTELEEIVVTAQKREERPQDVPISLSVLGGEEIERSTVQGATDALIRVPGVTIMPSQRSVISVRGVTPGGSSFAGSSTVGYYVDGVPFALVKNSVSPDPNVYDLQRIEVLKGPQGTLYGANSLGGIIRVLTNDPNLERVEFKAATGVSTVKGGGDGYRADMAVNVPLIEGKLAVRAVAGYNQVAGWIDRPNLDNANEALRKNYRLKVKAQPTESLSIGVSAWRSTNSYKALANGNLADVNPKLTEPYEESFDTYGLTVGYEFPGMTLTSTTSYVDWNHVDVNRDPPPADFQYILTQFQSRVLTEELLLNSSDEGLWTWSIGAFYRDANDPQLQDFFGYTDGDGNPLPHAGYPVAIDWRDTSESQALFGQLTRKFFDNRFAVSGGLRYFKDNVAQIEDIHFYIDPAGANDPPAVYRRTYNAVTPRVVLNWFPNPEHTAYLTYSQGYRSGFDQDVILRLFSDVVLPQAKPDKLTNFELGAKGTLFSDRLRYEAAVYYYKWKDIQQAIGVPIPGDQIAVAITNGASASGPGFELSLDARPIEGLNLGIGFSYNDLTFDSDVADADDTPLFLKGSRLNESPEYTGRLSADYSMPLGSVGYTGTFSTSANYISKNGASVVRGGSLSQPGENIVLTRAAFRVAAPRNWEAAIYCENLLDKRLTVDFPAEGAEYLRLTQPRTFGLQLDYRFE